MKRLITLIFIFASITAFGQSVTRQLTFNSKISEGNNPDSLGFTGPGLQPGYFYKAAYIRTHFGGTDSLYFNTTIGGLGTFLSPLGVVMDTIGYLKADWYIRNNAHIFKADSMQVLNAPVNPNGVLRKKDTAIFRSFDNSLSKAQIQTGLNLKANLASPILTGTPTTPTVSSAADSTTKIASTAFVHKAIAAAGGVSTIYNSDGTLSGNRTVNINGNNLQFSGGLVGWDYGLANLTLDQIGGFNFSMGASTASFLSSNSTNGSLLGYQISGVLKYVSANPDSLGIRIGDNISHQGAFYDGVYHSTNPAWLTPKKYVDSLVAASSGGVNVYNTDGVITGNRTIGLNGSRTFTIGDLSASDFASLSVAATGGVNAVAQGDELNLQLNNTYFFTRDNDFSGKTRGFYLNEGGAIVARDSLSSRGIVYPANYEAQFVDNSLVTKHWVTSNFGAALGFTPENVANKATSFGTLNNTIYPTTQAVATYVAAQIPATPSLQSVATVGNSYTGQIQAQNLAATGTAGAGYDDLISQSASPTSTTGHIKIYSDSLNRLSWKNSTYRRTIQVPYPSDYTIRMPYLVTGTTLEDSTHAATTYGTITNLALKANIASPTFTGTVTIPTPFTLGATSVTSTGTQLNYLNAATGTTGTTSTNLVYSTSPMLVTPALGVATATSLNGNTFTTGTYTLTGAAGKTLTFNNSLTFSGTDGGVITIPSGTVTLVTMGGANNLTNANSINRNAIGAVSTQALVAGNSTAATVGTTSQWSPYIGFTAGGWNTTSAASNTVNFNTELRPVSAAAVTGDLVTKSQVNAGGFTDIFTLNSSGAVNHTGTILATANNQIATGITGSYTFTDGAFTGVVHSAMKLTFGAALGSQFNITDATGTGDVDLHFGNANPSSSNFAFRGNTTNTYLNAPGASGTIFFRVANTTLMSLPNTGILNLVTAPATSSGTPDILSRNTSTGNIEKIPFTSIAAFAVATATDANATISASMVFETLPVITANRTVSIPSASTYSGQMIVINNLNTSGTFSWSFTGATVKDASGNTLTTLANGAVYELLSNGTSFVKIN